MPHHQTTNRRRVAKEAKSSQRARCNPQPEPCSILKRERRTAKGRRRDKESQLRAPPRCSPQRRSRSRPENKYWPVRRMSQSPDMESCHVELVRDIGAAILRPSASRLSRMRGLKAVTTEQELKSQQGAFAEIDPGCYLARGNLDFRQLW